MKDKYSKMFGASLLINSLVLIINALNNTIWNSDILMWVFGIIELICIPIIVFSTVKILINKK